MIKRPFALIIIVKQIYTTESIYLPCFKAVHVQQVLHKEEP